MDKNLDLWSKLALAACGGTGLLAYAMMKEAEMKRELKREDLNLRDYIVWTCIAARPHNILNEQLDENNNTLSKEQILSLYYEIADKFISRTKVFNDLEDKNLSSRLRIQDLNLRDETVFTMLVCEPNIFKLRDSSVFDEYTNKCYDIVDMYIVGTKAHEDYLEYLKEFERIEKEVNKATDMLTSQNLPPINGINTCPCQVMDENKEKEEKP